MTPKNNVESTGSTSSPFENTPVLTIFVLHLLKIIYLVVLPLGSKLLTLNQCTTLEMTLFTSYIRFVVFFILIPSNTISWFFSTGYGKLFIYIKKRKGPIPRIDPCENPILTTDLRRFLAIHIHFLNSVS